MQGLQFLEALMQEEQEFCRLQFLEALTQEKQEFCRLVDSLFETPNSKFTRPHNETILSLQYCKCSRKKNKDAEQWMGRIRIMTAECKYNELGRDLKEQFINVLNDGGNHKGTYISGGHQVSI